MCLPTQLTATTRLKQVVKAREPRASPLVPTPPAPPAQVHTGGMRAFQLTNPTTGAPWSLSLLQVYPLPPPLPPHDLVDPKIHLSVRRWTLLELELCSLSLKEIAQSRATLILSGECLHLCAGVQISPIQGLTGVPTEHAQLLLPSLWCTQMDTQRVRLTHSE